MTSVVIAQPGEHGKGEAMQMAAPDTSGGMGAMGGLPPGLAYLGSLNEILIHQQFDMLEVVSGCERNNRYSLCNSSDQQFMFAQEDTDCMTRQCCKNMRPFTLNLTDNNGVQVLQLYRPYRCFGYALWCCCMQEMDIMSPPGVAIGSVKQVWTCITPHYEVHDGQGNHVFTINGDCCFCMPCQDIIFKVTDPQGQDVGQIIKHWSGLREMCGQVNDFRIQFPAHMPIFNKALLIGATFLMDFIYFERKD